MGAQCALNWGLVALAKSGGECSLGRVFQAIKSADLPLFAHCPHRASPKLVLGAKLEGIGNSEQEQKVLDHHPQIGALTGMGAHGVAVTVENRLNHVGEKSRPR